MRLWLITENHTPPQQRTQCFGQRMYFLSSLRNTHVSQVLSYFQLRFSLYA